MYSSFGSCSTANLKFSNEADLASFYPTKASLPESIFLASTFFSSFFSFLGFSSSFGFSYFSSDDEVVCETSSLLE